MTMKRQKIYKITRTIMKLKIITKNRKCTLLKTRIPYDKCVANKMIDGNQYTIVCYINDNNKFSHINPNVVMGILEEINKHFGELVIS